MSGLGCWLAVATAATRSWARDWTVLAVRLPATPSRHRVAVWRELRGIGALSLCHGVWAVPATPGFTEGLDRAMGLAQAGEGHLAFLDATGRDEADSARLEDQFTASREAE
jgi:hypothetical protein